MNASPAAGGRRLVLDARVIEKTENARLVLGQVTKHPGNPLFKEQHPWEARFDNLYANIIYDREDKLYKCWYSPFIVDSITTDTPREKRATARYRPRRRRMGVCYATSEDGIRWRKPLMSICPFNGKKSNIVSDGPHGAGVFKDLAEKDPARRYKMFCKSGGVAVAFSLDGMRWTKPAVCPQIRAAADTHNNAFRAPDGEYVGITRLWDGQRIVGRTQSPDFVRWTRAVEVLRGTKTHQTYAITVFRHAGAYLGLLMIFRTREDRVHCELTWSGDTVKWHRVCPGTPLIANSKKRGHYDWGCVYAAACPVFGDSEIRLYYGASNGPHTGWRDGFLALATLRPDGFAGYEQVSADAPALVTTVPLSLAGRSLRLSADVRKGGSVAVALLDKTGREIARARPVKRTVTDGKVAWTNAAVLEKLKAAPVRLRFELKNATLYSFVLPGPERAGGR